MGYKYLTFDCFGTLIDWRTGIERELLAGLGKVNIRGEELLEAYLVAEREEEATYKKYREVLRRSAIAMSEALGAEISDDVARKFAGAVPRWPAFPDTAQFLHEMGAKGYKRYILSNVDDDMLEDTIENHHLEVDGFVTAEQVGSYKPNIGHWSEFLRRTQAQKEEVLHVAQSVYHDIIPAQQFGISSAWINRYEERLPRGASPKIISDSLESLAKTID